MLNLSTESSVRTVGGEKTWSVGTLTYTRRGLAALFCWLLWGDFAWQMRDRTVPAVIQLLFKKFDASDTLTGLMIGSLPAALTILLVPIVSYKSDRHRGRWGRRIPFLLIPIPIVTFSMAALAFGPRIGAALHQALGAASPGLNQSILIVLGLLWIAFEFACIMANSLFGALVNDVVPQPILGRFFALFRAVSLISGIIFNYALIGKAEIHYQWMFLALSVLYGGGFTLMCVKVKEGEYPPPPAEKGEGQNGFFRAAVTYFRDCFGMPYYLWYFAAFSLSVLAFTPFNVFSVYFAKSVGMSMDAYGKCYAFTFLISFALAYPLGSLVDRLHPLRMCMATLVLYAGVSLWGGFYSGSLKAFSVVLIVQGVLAGCFWTSSASLAQRLLPRSRFAELESARGIIASILGILTPALMGVWLDHARHAYHHTLFAGFGIAMAGLFCSAVLYGKFMKHGGPRHYVAPE